MFDRLRHMHRRKEAIHSPHGLKLGLWIRGRFLLTCREQEIPHFYKWWDELRLTRRFLDFRILLYYNVFTNQSYLMERI